MSRPHLVVLCSPNRNRLAHLRKLGALRDRYHVTCLRIGAGMGWEKRFVDREVEIPETARGSPLPAAIASLDVGDAPDGIVNLYEGYLPLHSDLCRHYRLIGPGPAAVRVGRNKLHMRQFCRELGLPVPRFELLTSRTLEACRRLRYPIVVKPAIGCSSTLVQRIESSEELDGRFPEIRAAAERVYQKDLLRDATIREFGELPFVAEELLDGDLQFATRLPYPVGEISVESIAHGGRTTVLAIHDAPVPANGPFFEKIVNSTPSRLPAVMVATATDIVSRLHAALGSGAYVLHTEMRTFAGHLVLLEFGVRIGGSSIYRSVLHSTGCDFIEALARLSLGEAPDVGQGRAQPTITHYLVPRRPGRIRSIRGLSHLSTSPFYVDHELYDDVGDVVQRPPFRNRASGYFALRGGSFDELESEALRLLETVTIEVES